MALNGPLSFLDPQLPDNKQISLDPAVQGLLNDTVKRASADTASFGQATNQGIDERVGQLNQSNNSIKQMAAKTGQDPAMLEAISGAYGSQAHDQIQKIKSQNDFNAPLRKANALSGAAAAVLGQQQAKNSFYQSLTDAYNQSEANRAQLVSTLFQTGTQAYMYNKKNSSQGMQMGQGQQTPASNYNQDPYTLA